MIGLGEDTHRKIRSIRVMTESGKLDREGFLNLAEKASGRDVEVSTIMLRALAKSEAKYEEYKMGMAMGDGKYHDLPVHEQDAWLFTDYLKSEMGKVHNEKEFMESVLAPQLSSTLLQRENEVKKFQKAQVKKERAEALGLKIQEFKKSVGLSR